MLEMIIAQVIWKSRNEALFNQVFQSPSQALDNYVFFFNSISSDSTHKPLKVSAAPNLNNPTEMLSSACTNIIIYVDGAFKNNQRSYGCYISHNNRTILFWAGWIGHVSHLNVVEAYVCYFGLIYVKKWLLLGVLFCN